ncbi:MAG: sigma-70 family RNA polymerase sigma factor [Bacteroidia bacterium]|nr:sigma-70 family RNA polymerase sigma factor [Bacteroidia bacterium]
MTAIEFNYQLVGLQDHLKNYATSLTSNKQDALDLLQETNLKAIRYREMFEDHTNLKAWTYTIMKNTFINTYRKSVKQNTMFDSTKDLYFLSLPQDSGIYSPESQYNSSEITKTIDQLEDEYRIPFTMHTTGYKYKEISEKLNLPIGTVKSRIFFTRKKLMDALKAYGL